MKHCPKCDTEKEVSEFNKRSASKDGLRWWCRSCDHSATNKWLSANRNVHLERQKQWALKNKEQKASKAKAWAKNNRHKENARTAKRKASKIAATPAWSDLSAVEDFYSAALAFRMYTGQEYHVDHIVPCRAFDQSNEAQRKICWHFTNMRPIWSRANMRKSGTIDHKNSQLGLPL